MTRTRLLRAVGWLVVAFASAPSLAAQSARPRISADVDRDRIVVGDELVFTVRATSGSATPLAIAISPPSGLEVIARTERTEIAYGGDATRTTTLELRLRALRPGRWEIGPAIARQGTDSAEADAIAVDVIDAPNAAHALLNPRVRTLLEHAPPPRSSGAVALTVSLSADTARVGEQVDVVTAAWFPRDLRLQLRRAPVLLPPVLSGVWSYPQSAPPGIAASRRVGELWYDLFIAHQVVFPLVAGRVTVPPAELHYSVPVALQFFSQEERYTVESRPSLLQVMSLPDLHRPADFTGTVARGLTLDRSVTPATATPGEAVSVAVSLTGRGNLALWPAPAVEWPADFRAYPERTDEQIETHGGWLGGTKTFHYLVVPQRPGQVSLPALSYAYFDPALDDYTRATAGSARLAVAAGGEGLASRALPPDLLPPRGAPLALEIADALPATAWALLAFLPPIGVVVLRRGRRRRVRPVPLPPVDSVEAAQVRLDAVLRALVAVEALREGRYLAQALRGAGVEPAVAARAARARDRLRALRFGPTPGAADAALLAEVDALVARLDARAREGGTRRARAIRAGVLMSVAAVAVTASASPIVAQLPSAERLYQTGALRAAADAFEARTHADSRDPAAWYDLGAARYRLGDDGAAAAAWLRAARLSPRDATVRRALRLTPPPDDGSSERRWVPPLTTQELALAALAAWVAGWVLLARHRRRAGQWFAASGVLLGALALGAHLWLATPLALAEGTEPMRVSPHGRAAAAAKVESGAALRVLGERAGWLLVDGPNGERGWLPVSAVAMVSE